MPRIKTRSTPDYNNSELTYYLQVVTHDAKGRRFADNVSRIKLTDCWGNYIQWVNDAQAALLEESLPGQIQWK